MRRPRRWRCQDVSSRVSVLPVPLGRREQQSAVRRQGEKCPSRDSGLGREAVLPISRERCAPALHHRIPPWRPRAVSRATGKHSTAHSKGHPQRRLAGHLVGRALAGRQYVPGVSAVHHARSLVRSEQWVHDRAWCRDGHKPRPNERRQQRVGRPLGAKARCGRLARACREQRLSTLPPAAAVGRTEPLTARGTGEGPTGHCGPAAARKDGRCLATPDSHPNNLPYHFFKAGRGARRR